MLGIAFVWISILTQMAAGSNAKRAFKRPEEDDVWEYFPVTDTDLLFNTAESIAVFENPILPEPKIVWNYFLGLVETPRGSGNQAKIVPKLLEWIGALGLSAKVDDAGNILVTKAASPGAELWPGICLQAHYDIVAVKLDNVDIDLLNDPLKPQIVSSPDPQFGNFALKATGTSLGGDNGIGVALALSVLADNTLKHGPLEVLLTADEEISLIGAMKLAPGTLESQYLINLDNQESWRICIGCAGGFQETLHFSLSKAETTGIRILINLRQLKGGHSGIQIDLGRANANKVLAEAVDVVSRATGISDVLSALFFEGGFPDIRNVIAPEAQMAVVVPLDRKDEFISNFQIEVEKLQAEWKTIEPDLELTYTADDVAESYVAYTPASTQKVFDLIHALPHGVHRFSPDVEGLVESSFNLARVVLLNDSNDPSEVRFEYSARSSDNAQMPFMHDKLASLTRLGGGSTDGMFNYFPGWRADTTSNLLAVAKSEYKRLTKKDAVVYALHAGLEPGLLIGSHPNLKAISLGANTWNLHSPDEVLSIDSVPVFYRLVVGILAELKE